MIKITQSELNEFYVIVSKTMHKYPQLRKGQTYFNVAYDLWPEETNKIRGTNDDCFHDDSKIENFMKYFDVVDTDKEKSDVKVT